MLAWNVWPCLPCRGRQSKNKKTSQIALFHKRWKRKLVLKFLEMSWTKAAPPPSSPGTSLRPPQVPAPLFEKYWLNIITHSAKQTLNLWINAFVSTSVQSDTTQYMLYLKVLKWKYFNIENISDHIPVRADARCSVCNFLDNCSRTRFWPNEMYR